MCELHLSNQLLMHTKVNTIDKQFPSYIFPVVPSSGNSDAINGKS